MKKEQRLADFKVKLIYEFKKLHDIGIHVILYSWDDNNLNIHVNNDDMLEELADILKKKCSGILNEISIAIIGNTKILKL
ncbi:MAG: hypothetical protein JW881_21985 [Spirochaetales bacterium]|nr:hypothetical protein [Spirochaetales bacterium]